MRTLFRNMLVLSVIALAIGLIPFSVATTSAQQTVYSDDMSNAATGLMSEVSPNPIHRAFS
ncbi:hypothetical protein BH24CHL4_BH24CHL4_17720 [soil metagenome]